MKFGSFVPVVFAIIYLTGSTSAQDEAVTHLIQSMLAKSEYVHKVFFQLLSAKVMDIKPEPFIFDNFTVDHFFIFQDGISHTYNPLLHGFSNSTFTVDASNETYRAYIHLNIPQANLTGTYDLDIEEGFFAPRTRYTGDGEFMHVFYDVDLYIRLTVDTTVDGTRTIATDVRTELHFSRCELWAENFRTDGVLWSDAKWTSQSAQYKVNHYENAPYTDIILSETVTSYFGMFWGLFEFSRDDAIQSLISFGEEINP